MPTVVRCLNPRCSAKVKVSDTTDRTKAHCPKCGSRLPDDEDFAADILADTTDDKRPRTDRTFEDMQIFEEAPKASIEPSKPKVTAKKYGTLRVMAVLFELGGVIAGVVCFLGMGSAPQFAAAYFVAAIVSFLVLFSCGELISLLIDIEENTRR